MSTLLHRLSDWAAEEPQAPMHASKAGADWQFTSAAEVNSRVEALARYLISEGLQAGDIGLIYAYNCAEWAQMDLAFTLAGGASAGIYINAPPRQIQFILRHSEAKFLVVDTVESLKAIFQDKSVSEFAPNLLRILLITPPSKGTELTANFGDQVRTFAQALEGGKKIKSPSGVELRGQINPDKRAVLIYTSGTTGQPKAVSLSHKNLTFAATCYSASWSPQKNGRVFSFLPLAHIAERMLNIGFGITYRSTVYFCSSPMAFASELREVQPTILLAVPRLWDKLKQGFESKLKHLPMNKQKTIKWALGVGSRYGILARANWSSPEGGVKSTTLLDFDPTTLISRALLFLQFKVANQLVLKTIRSQLGLGACERTVSGAAALAPSTLDWYRSIGIRLIEAYALSETCGVLTCGIGDQETGNSVGVVYPGIEILLAEDGEILTRGQHVFLDYFKDPESTKEVFANGWFKTGDLGAYDDRGYLIIKGRKREIIKTAEGKMVSPLYIENQILTLPVLDQAVVIGSERPYLVALLTLTEVAQAQVKKNPDDLSIYSKMVSDHLTVVNGDLASHERVKRFKILGHQFSIEKEELTATMKIKRSVIETNYRSEIDLLYK